MQSNLKTIVVAVFATLTVLFIYDYFKHSNDVREELFAQSALIEKQLRNVSKLVVTEASYAKVYHYENKETYGLDIFTSEKNALVVSNAHAQVAYNLRELKYDLDPSSKTITITHIPKAELTIDPNLQFYRIENGYFNKFQAQDLNNIKVKITKDLRSNIMKSDMMKNAENRLLSELSQIYVLTASLEWTLVYNGNIINNAAAMETLLP